MLDVVFIAGILALVALVALVGEGGGEAVIVFEIVAVVLALAAIGYLVFALVKPERF